MSTENASILPLFTWFHQHPEVGHTEFATTQKIKETLEEMGLDPQPLGSLPTGTFALIKGSHPGKTLLLRSDIDALPVTEKADVDYPSLNTGKMHACGHDIHMTTVLTAARILTERKDQLHGTVFLAFQPAEEVAGGAVELLDQGVTKGCTEFVGLHSEPLLPVGTLGITAGCVMASTDTFRITLTGTGTHAAAPHLGNNPIPVLFGLGRELMLFSGQKVSPVHNYVLSITHVEAGEAWNVIPDTAMLEGTIRCEYPEDRETLRKALYRLVGSYAEEHQVQADIYWHDGAPAVLNDEELVRPAAELAQKEGLQVKALEMAMTGDDFSRYKEYALQCQATDPDLQPAEKPLALYVKVGTGLSAPLHNSHFKADPAAIGPAARFLADFITERLSGE